MNIVVQERKYIYHEKEEGRMRMRPLIICFEAKMYVGVISQPIIESFL